LRQFFIPGKILRLLYFEPREAHRELRVARLHVPPGIPRDMRRYAPLYRRFQKQSTIGKSPSAAEKSL
jgi:hypothetical protein